MQDVTDRVKPYCPEHWEVVAWTEHIPNKEYIGTIIQVYIPDINVKFGLMIEPRPGDPQFEELIKMVVQRGQFKERQWKEQHPQS